MISTDQRFLTLQFATHNTQRGLDTSYTIQVKRTLPNGEDTIYSLTGSAALYKENHSITFPIFADEHIGENKFAIELNPERGIQEQHYTNNQILQLQVQVTSDDLIPVFPAAFEILPDKNIIIRASTADPNAPEREYRFELDIKSDFSSPMKKEYNIVAPGGVVEWNPRIDFAPDSVVYYWRCTPQATNAADLRWRESSFQIVSNKKGWGQYDFDQYRNNDFESIEYNQANQVFEFNSRSQSIYAQNKGIPTTGAEWNTIYWSKNGGQQGFASICRGWPSMMIAVIDPGSLESWEVYWVDSSVTPAVHHNPENNFGNFNGYDLSQPNSRQNCTMPDKKFMFRVGTPAEMDSMVSMLSKHIPDSFYILAYSGRTPLFKTNWQNHHFQAFEDLGADSIRFLEDSVPYIFFAQKGKPSSAQEVWGKDPFDFITFTTQIQGVSGRGVMTSPEIGPVDRWREINWHFQASDVQDSIFLKLYGRDDAGEKHLGDLGGHQGYLADLSQAIPDINDYPYLRMEAHFIDSTFNKAPQLKKWHLYFDPAPEVAVAPGERFSLHADTVMQGEAVVLELAIQNIGSVSNPPMPIDYLILDKNNKRIPMDRGLLPTLDPGAIKIDTLTLPTEELSGPYSLVIDVNPQDSGWVYEQEHFNNVMAAQTFVVADQTNPLLDVTFDGVHILDGDLVSARPEIGISLDDDNPFMLLEDTSSFEVYLTYPDKRERRVYFRENPSGTHLNFTPASNAKNKARVNFDPVLTEDGVYKLRVRATDASGNESGKLDYQVHFEVINKSTITQIMNYPNPFTTSTRFVFTLTGWKVPDYFRIQILTVTGKVVKEIDRGELGEIRIGKNITSYAWDGTDQYGDRLANGVYFYRVITRIEGEEIEHRSSGADNWFKKDFGKMYLMR
ncbi:hypothetical protein KFE98_09290 [bacterium SCSIO 12741]|nr:hypothetical protein KFE98_09290 [bacterium SCSIO 12741]